MRGSNHGYARETQEAIYCGPGGRARGAAAPKLPENLKPLDATMPWGTDTGEQ